jgi:hypothetical protein
MKKAGKQGRECNYPLQTVSSPPLTAEFAKCRGGSGFRELDKHEKAAGKCI